MKALFDKDIIFACEPEVWGRTDDGYRKRQEKGSDRNGLPPSFDQQRSRSLRVTTAGPPSLADLSTDFVLLPLFSFCAAGPEAFLFLSFPFAPSQPMLLFILVLFFLPSATAFTAIRFSSIRQCGPFNVTFSGNQPTALPLALTVVPFGSSATPISIPLPNPEWDSTTSTGIAITFLPYPAGTTFVASLDDAAGQGTGFTSDIIKILQSDDTSCVSTAEKAQTYTAKPPFSQCQPFNVTFDPTRAVPPVVRLFVPNGQAPLLNRTQDTHEPGTTSFTMAAFRGQPAVLLFRDGSNHLQSTDLFTVIGDVTSSKACFPPPPNINDWGKPQQTGLSR